MILKHNSYLAVRLNSISEQAIVSDDVGVDGVTILLRRDIDLWIIIAWIFFCDLAMVCETGCYIYVYIVHIYTYIYEICVQKNTMPLRIVYAAINRRRVQYGSAKVNAPFNMFVLKPQRTNRDIMLWEYECFLRIRWGFIRHSVWLIYSPQFICLYSQQF